MEYLQIDFGAQICLLYCAHYSTDFGVLGEMHHSPGGGVSLLLRPPSSDEGALPSPTRSRDSPFLTWCGP